MPPNAAASGPPKKETSHQGERTPYFKNFREWRGVVTRSNRVAMPEDAWWDLQNLQPIGPANIHCVPNISASLHDFTTDTVYYSEYANVGGFDYIFFFTTNGKVIAYKQNAGTFVQINGGHLFSGAGSAMSQWQNAVVVFSDANGIFAWDGTTFFVLSGTTSCPASGQAIAVFGGRVWISQNRTLYFSAANSYTDYQVSSGGGTTTLTDPQIRTSIQRLVSANGYMYAMAGSAINVIADVYVPAGASPPAPVFSNVNIQSIIGTDQPYSIFPFNRYLMFANKYGGWALSGTTAQKISDDIDGTWQYLDTTKPISGGQVVVNNILTAAFLIQRLNDPVFGSNVVIGMWWDNKWWFCNFGAITLLVSAIIANVPRLYCMIGNNLYQLFADTATAPNTAWRTALWPMDDNAAVKEALRAGIELTVDAAYANNNLTLNLDTENTSTPINLGATSSFVAWINNASQIVQWQNNALSPVNWYNTTFQLFAGMSPGGYGRYIGFSGSSVGLAFEMQGMMMDYQFAKRW